MRLAEHIPERGLDMFEQVRKMGLEGIMAKKGDAPYRAGRSDHWLKMRADRRAAFAIVGWASGKGSRAALGALLLGVQTDEASCTSAGSAPGLRERQINELVETAGSGCARTSLRSRSPSVRQPLRQSAEAGRDSLGRARALLPGAVQGGHGRRAAAAPRVRALAPGPAAARVRCRAGRSAACRCPAPGAGARAPEEVAAPAGKTVITRPEKVFWPDEGYTKGDLIDYYRAVADWILPYLEDRPLVLDRYPDGIAGKSFFQKHAPHFTPGVDQDGHDPLPLRRA